MKLASLCIAAGLAWISGAALPAAAATGDISTVAGGFTGDGASAAEARLNKPLDVCVDGAGNTYIADTGHCRVRKVDAATGAISTVAGNGETGYSGDGGAATDARLNAPSGIRVDGSGNIYIGDTNNNRVRRVDAATGLISTVAGNGETGIFSVGDGGPATSGNLSSPVGVAVDSVGNLYIAEQGGGRVRRVDAKTGVISALAGDVSAFELGDGGPATDASLTQPAGVFVDPAGNVYIADEGHRRVRRVDGATGVITTVAGNGESGDTGDGGPATDAKFRRPTSVFVDSAGTLYISDWFDGRVRKVDPATGILSLVAGDSGRGHSADGQTATDASLTYPRGLCVDAAGDLYIAEDSNGLIRKVDAETGTLSTVAGNVESMAAGDGGSATTAGLYHPSSIFVDGAGNFYIADQLNRRIRKVDAQTGIITTIAGGGAETTDREGGPATEAYLGRPSGVCLDSSGSVYMAEQRQVRKVDGETGTISTAAGRFWSGDSGDGVPATDAQLGSPERVFVDRTDAIYIADWSDNRIRKVDPKSGLISTVAGTGEEGYSGDGGPATEAEFNSPSGVFVRSDGSMFIADKGNARIRKVDATGTITTVAGGADHNFDPPLGDGGPATLAYLSSPAEVFVDGAGSIFILEVGRRRVRKVDSQGIISTVAGNGEIGFNAPGEFHGDGGPATDAALYVNSSVYSTGGGIFIDGRGDLYIADRGNHRIRKVEGVAAPTDLWEPAATAKTPDFDGSGTVDFPDFVEFARNFNTSEGDPGFDARFDLDGDGKVSFPDFVAFATAFGKAA